MLQVKNEYNKLTKVLMASVDTFHLHEPINSTQEYFYKNDPPVLSKMIAEQNAFAETLVRNGVEVVWADRRDDCTNQVNTRDVAFVVGNRLYSYNVADSKLAYLFGFYDENNADERTFFDKNRIDIRNILAYVLFWLVCHMGACSFLKSCKYRCKRLGFYLVSYLFKSVLVKENSNCRLKGYIFLKASFPTCIKSAFFIFHKILQI